MSTRVLIIDDSGPARRTTRQNGMYGLEVLGKLPENRQQLLDALAAAPGEAR